MKLITRKRSGAFTLVELLVVIGIIALLIGMLFPALHRARDQANSINCASNLRQISLGLVAYSVDNHGWIIPSFNLPMQLTATTNDIAKAKIDEELRTAYKIQQRLLPDALPEIEGYRFAGANRPCKTVSGDYYDVVIRPDGRIYFVIADVSGKGITAALVMSSVATAFAIFTRSDPAPADLMRDINTILAPKTAPSKFVTMVVGVLDPATGVVDFANAGHVSPLVVSKNGVEAMSLTDIVVGILPHAQYRNQTLTLGPGDSLVLFTDGVTEAENIAEEQLGLDPISEMLLSMHGSEAPAILDRIDTHVHEFIGEVPAGDDVTMLAMTRL